MILFGCTEIRHLTKKKRIIEMARKNRLEAVKLHRKLFKSSLSIAIKEVNEWIDKR